MTDKSKSEISPGTALSEDQMLSSELGRLIVATLTDRGNRSEKLIRPEVDNIGKSETIKEE